MSKLSSQINGLKVFAIILLIFASFLLSIIGGFEILLISIIISIIILGAIGIFIEKSPLIIGASVGLIIILILVSLLYSYKDSSIIENNSILSDLTPKKGNYGKEKLNSLEGMLYAIFSILLLLYMEVGYSVIRFSKFSNLMNSYNEKGKKYGYEKTNFFTSKLKTSINQYYIFIGIYTVIILLFLILALNFNSILANIITEQLSKSIEFHAIYGQVLSIFALFAIIGVSRIFIPENRKKGKRKIKSEKKKKNVEESR